MGIAALLQEGPHAAERLDGGLRRYADTPSRRSGSTWGWRRRGSSFVYSTRPELGSARAIVGINEGRRRPMRQSAPNATLLMRMSSRNSATFRASWRGVVAR
jgi:hypothetical protein